MGELWSDTETNEQTNTGNDVNQSDDNRQVPRLLAFSAATFCTLSLTATVSTIALKYERKFIVLYNAKEI